MEFKVVINACYGGFGLSEKAFDKIKELKGHGDFDSDLPRHDKDLVKAVELLGEIASDSYAKLKVITIFTPLYRIEEYDGFESIEVPDQVEWINAND